MIEIIPANIDNIKDIQKVSKVAWMSTFCNILSDSQIEYMLEMMYSHKSLVEQMTLKNHHYVMAKCDTQFVGYMSYELDCEGSGKTKIHKIYICPDKQKMGIGKMLIDFAIRQAQESFDVAIYLNVNKNNSNAISFYQRCGFKLSKSEIIDIGNGFVMDDFVFEKQLVTK